MDQFLESLKPQLEAMNEMYKNGFEEGRRSAFAEMLPEIDKLQKTFVLLHPKQ